MNDSMLSLGTMAVIDWLGELGPRWGLPSEACRIHGLLFVLARPVPANEIAAMLTIEEPAVAEALGWRSKDRFVAQGPNGWSTHADPWTLVTQALEARREREIETAQTVREVWYGNPHRENTVVARQAQRLFELVEDISSISARIVPGDYRRVRCVR